MKKAASLIIRNQQNHYLLILRDNNINIPFPNHWDFIGGIVELNESPETAVTRECKEELGVIPSLISHYKTYSWTDKIEYVYETCIDLIPENIELTEGQEIEYFEIKNILMLPLAYNCKEILKDYLLIKDG